MDKILAAREILKQKSDKAIQKGNKFNGFLGVGTEQYTKEDLVMILNILFDELQDARSENIQISLGRH